MEIVLQALVWNTKNNYSKQINRMMNWSSVLSELHYCHGLSGRPFTFGCDRGGFGGTGVSILVGRGQHVLVHPPGLLTGHWSARRRQCEYLAIFRPAGGNIVLVLLVLLVFASLLLLPVPPLLVVLCCGAAPLWGGAIGAPSLH